MPNIIWAYFYNDFCKDSFSLFNIKRMQERDFLKEENMWCKSCINRTYIHTLIDSSKTNNTRRTKARTELKGERTVFDRNDLRCAKNLRGEGRSTTTFAQQGKGCEMLPLRGWPCHCLPPAEYFFYDMSPPPLSVLHVVTNKLHFAGSLLYFITYKCVLNVLSIENATAPINECKSYIKRNMTLMQDMWA